MLEKEALALLLEKAGKNALLALSVSGSDIPLYLKQAGYTIEDMEKYLPRPTRVRQQVALKSPQAFVAYVKKFGLPETVIFVNDRVFVAKIDYHGADEAGEMGAPLPSWCEHTARYEPKFAHQWVQWSETNGKHMSQLDFADFLEERLAEIVTPSSAQVLTAVLDFKETADHVLESAHTPRTGDLSFKFVKQGRPLVAAAFPHDIQITLPIFDYHAPVTLDAEIRYNTSGGKLTLWYQFKRDPIDIVRTFFEVISGSIQTDLSIRPFFEGSAG